MPVLISPTLFFYSQRDFDYGRCVSNRKYKHSRPWGNLSIRSSDVPPFIRSDRVLARPGGLRSSPFARNAYLTELPFLRGGVPFFRHSF